MAVISIHVSPSASFLYWCPDSCHLPPSPTVRNQFRSHCLLKLSLEGDFTPNVTWCLIRAVTADGSGGIRWKAHLLPQGSTLPGWSMPFPLPILGSCSPASQGLVVVHIGLHRTSSYSAYTSTYPFLDLLLHAQLQVLHSLIPTLLGYGELKAVGVGAQVHSET